MHDRGGRRPSEALLVNYRGGRDAEHRAARPDAIVATPYVSIGWDQPPTVTCPAVPPPILSAGFRSKASWREVGVQHNRVQHGKICIDIRYQVVQHTNGIAHGQRIEAESHRVF